MKKLILSLLLFLFATSMYSQELVYNCHLSNNRSPEVVDEIKRTIKKVDNTIIFQPYKNNRDLVLNIDSVVNNPKGLGLKKNKDWYYCTDKYHFRYIVIGLGTSQISLFQLITEVDVFEEIFNSLKED